MNTRKGVKEVAKTLHYNRKKPSHSKVATTSVANGTETTSFGLPLYIPENINIDDLLSKYPLEIPQAKDKLAYVLHLVNSVPASRKDFDYDKNNGYSPINKKLLQSRIHQYRMCIDYLIRIG